MAKRTVYKKTTLMFYDTDIAIHNYLTELSVRKRSNIQSEIMNLLEEKMKADLGDTQLQLETENTETKAITKAENKLDPAWD